MVVTQTLVFSRLLSRLNAGTWGQFLWTSLQLLIKNNRIEQTRFNNTRKPPALNRLSGRKKTGVLVTCEIKGPVVTAGGLEVSVCWCWP